MVTAFVSDLERLVSKPRLDKYRSSNNDDLETIASYLWNVSLSEALLQGISALEVSLRNSIHNAFTQHAGTDQWFWAILKKSDLAVATGKWTRLAEILKEPPISGKVIADLTFGFWPYLFEQRYHDLWWNNGEALLQAVFPYRPRNAPPHARVNQAEILKRLNLFIDLRNRVMHHEPIMFGVAQPDLGNPPPIVTIAVIHTQIREMLDWIDPQTSLSLSFVDRFPDVLLNERERIRTRIENHFATS